MIAVELVEFPASEEFKANVSKSALALANSLKKLGTGLVSFYSALQIEDQKTGHVVVVWETVEHHKELMAKPEYSEVVTAVGQCLEGEKLEMQHVNYYHFDSSKILEAPVVELCELTVKSGEDPEEVKQLFRELFSGPPPAGFHGFDLDVSLERKDTVVLLIGWDSVEIHQKVMSDGKYKTGLQHVLSKADAKIAHFKLHKF